MKKILQKIFSIKNEYIGTTKRKIVSILFFKIKLHKQNINSPEYLIKKGQWYYEMQIETSSFCNAKCSFCPNSTLKRKKNFMTDEIFNLIIKRAKDEKLKIERFILHLNGEPLTDKKLAKRIKIQKQELCKNCSFSQRRSLYSHNTKTFHSDVNNNYSTPEEISLLSKIDEDYKQLFINTNVLRKQPLKLLELGKLIELPKRQGIRNK